MEKYICIHGHFYQPPRENPWIEAIERQESAHPYHDWNQRVSAECYEPNGVARILDAQGRIVKIVNNYARISFNFGPTLLSWLEAEEPETYARILDADKESVKRFSGHGSAMAQGYNHAILPLCNARDKATQIRWGVRDFIHRFGRKPEGMWLPETAVDLQALDLMAREGVKFAVLAPHQARRFRARGENPWQETATTGIDTSMAYEVELSGGRSMALFFYDGAISSAVGFQKLLSDGAAFVNRLMGGFSPAREHPQLVHMAVDGETFGHHHRFGEMALAWALDKIESDGGVRLTNYGEFLEKHPPTHQVEVWEESSWSCCHGVGRWREDCGCSTGSNPGWRQGWRTPLRRALDGLRDRLAPLYESCAGELLRDPWAARDGYIALVLERTPEALERFLAAHARTALDAAGRVRALKLLEMQRHALLMFTSCGWFFDDIAGIEALQVLQYAARAIQLAEDLFGKGDFEPSFLETLQEARSNRPEMGDGRDLYLRFVKPAAIDDLVVAARYAFRSLFQDLPARAGFYSYTVERGAWQTLAQGEARLVLGSCRLTSAVTTDTLDVELAAIRPANAPVDAKGGATPWNAQACLRHATGGGFSPEAEGDIRDAFAQGDFGEALRLVKGRFDAMRVEMQGLPEDEQREIFGILIAAAGAELGCLERQAFALVAPIVDVMPEFGMTPPPRFAGIATAHLHVRLLDEFRARPVHAGRIQSLVEEANARNVQWNRNALEPEIREVIERLARAARRAPCDPEALRDFAAAVRAERHLPFAVDLHEVQTQCYFLLRRQPAGWWRAAVEEARGGGEGAAACVEDLHTLGDLLAVNTECASEP
ncbi:MAG: DUF3536 domain-containing protein [Acidobacteriota bacterium]|nr:DUF3536 domain-containing protein [Acidobacteriota bacterium]